MDKSKKILYWLAGAIVVIFAFIDIAWIWLKVVDAFPETTGVTYVNYLTDAKGNKYSFMEVNYYADADNSGLEVFELNFNYYTDHTMRYVKKVGIQRLIDYSQLNGYENFSNEKKDKARYLINSYFTSFKDGVLDKDARDKINFEFNMRFGKSIGFLVGYFWYDGYEDITWRSVSEFKEGDPMYVDIEGELFSVQLTGKYTIREKKASLGKAVGDIFGFIFGGGVDGEFGMNMSEKTGNQYTYEDFVNVLAYTVIYSSAGYTDYILPLVNLSDFFTVKQYNSKGQLMNLDYSTFDFNYFSFEVKTNKRGMVLANQSLFKMVAGDSSYNTTKIYNGDYHQYEVHYQLTEYDFDIRTGIDGSYASIKASALQNLVPTTNKKVSVVLDLNNLYYGTDKIDLIGLDYSALIGLQIDSLTILSSRATTFTFLNYSLWDTNINTIYRDSAVTLAFESLAINSSYTEVVR